MSNDTHTLMVYLFLWNGHKPGQLPDDCGEDGPILGPYKYVQVTYGSHIKAYKPNDECEDFVVGQNGWISHDGVLYGDFSIITGDYHV
jgi:hypothetical protein